MIHTNGNRTVGLRYQNACSSLISRRGAAGRAAEAQGCMPNFETRLRDDAHSARGPTLASPSNSMPIPAEPLASGLFPKRPTSPEQWRCGPVPTHPASA
jgi:hypothetical protein